ncbi:MAG: DUF421 domain-containing protein [Nitrospirae bacterium]|jgi:uncharacterized membrane protein YcaP (DUF421 family)|nr:DUF421 domain-containing protein [Nitrospirota bacterium]
MIETTNEFMEHVFGGNRPEYPLSAAQVAVRAAAIYVAGVAIIRVGKSRLLSRATPLDVILGFILGSLLSRGITGHSSITDTVVASSVLIAVHWGFTGIACRWPWFENLTKGHAYVLVEHGQERMANMRQSHITSSDLSEAMRLQGIRCMAEVECAFKERNGEVSVIRRTSDD